VQAGGIRVVALKAEDGSQVWVKTLGKPTSKHLDLSRLSFTDT
jgi:hypothetical protein